MPLFPPLAVEALLSAEGRVRCFPLNAARGAERSRPGGAARPPPPASGSRPRRVPEALVGSGPWGRGWES